MKLNSDNISTIAKALVAAQKEMGTAVKDSKNPFFKSSYADLNSVREAVLPAFNKHGISVLQPTIMIDGKKFVQTLFLHESGEHLSGLTEILSTKELDAQAQGSGISYARRYGLQSMANVGAEDDDGNVASGKTSYLASQKQEAVHNVVSVFSNTTTSEIGKVGATVTDTVNQTPVPGKRSFRNKQEVL